MESPSIQFDVRSGTRNMLRVSDATDRRDVDFSVLIVDEWLGDDAFVENRRSIGVGKPLFVSSIRDALEAPVL